MVIGTCWAYLPDGRICGQPAVGVHPEAWYHACARHLPLGLAPAEESEPLGPQTEDQGD